MFALSTHATQTYFESLLSIIQLGVSEGEPKEAYVFESPGRSDALLG